MQNVSSRLRKRLGSELAVRRMRRSSTREARPARRNGVTRQSPALIAVVRFAASRGSSGSADENAAFRHTAQKRPYGR
jgi:hypothetical protein